MIKPRVMVQEVRCASEIFEDGDDAGVGRTLRGVVEDMKRQMRREGVEPGDTVELTFRIRAVARGGSLLDPRRPRVPEPERW